MKNPESYNPQKNFDSLTLELIENQTGDIRSKLEKHTNRPNKTR